MVAAWPRWVASYGVMPQTYIVAARPGRSGARPPRRVVQRERRGPARAARAPRAPTRTPCAPAYPAVRRPGRQRPARRSRRTGAQIGGQGTRRPVRRRAAGTRRSRSSRSTRAPHRAAPRAMVRCSASVAPSAPSQLGRRSSPSISTRLVGQRLAGPAPQHGAQLVLDVEAHAVVDAVAPGRPACDRTCPPLRSALLITASNTAIRASRGSSAWASTYGRPSSSRAAATASQPGGTLVAPARSRPAARRRPARRSTAGTRPARAGRRAARSAAPAPQPVASETRYAATSRPASVPSGKSHSGRSPRTGL